MRLLETKQSLQEFLQFIAMRKRHYKEWAYLHIETTKNNPLWLEEITQSMGYYFQNLPSILMQFPKQNELILFTHNVNNIPLLSFEKAIYETFPRHMLKVTSSNLNDSGLKEFTKLVSPHIQLEDWQSQINLRRASRMANCIMIMDDDPLLLKQMEKTLSGFGTVITVEDPKDFFECYKTHAPDILFLDIHMPNARGTNMLEELLTNIDPNAFVVMISADTMEQTVLESKAKGTKGFVMKPLTRENLCHHLMRAPTFLSSKA